MFTAARWVPPGSVVARCPRGEGGESSVIRLPTEYRFVTLEHVDQHGVCTAQSLRESFLSRDKIGRSLSMFNCVEQN